MTELIFAIGNLLQWSFGSLRLLGNFPNFVFIMVIVGFLSFWIYQTQLFEKTQR